MKNAKGFINIVWCDRRGREARGKITFVQESNGENMSDKLYTL